MDLSLSVDPRSAELWHGGFFEEALAREAHLFIQATQRQSGISDRDGRSLLQHVFSEQTPILAFSERETPVERDLHDGLRFLAIGFHTAVRNVLVHDPEQRIDPDEAKVWLGLIHALRRRLDQAHRVEHQTPRAGYPAE